jgi:molybdenum cofactor cytidylyltransferase
MPSASLQWGGGALDSIMISGIVLAGGKSSRMGRPKALLPIGSTGDTFFDRVTRTLLEAGVEDVVVVVGADAAAIRAGARPHPGVRIVENPNYEHGQLSSLLVGLRALDASPVTAALVTLIDVPLVSAKTVRTLLAVQRERGAPVVRPVSNGRHGHPVIFGRAVFEELHAADPAQGAKPVVRAHAAQLVEVPVDDEGAFTDIDTPDDYDKYFGPLPT